MSATPRILLVDDEPAAIQVLYAALAGLGEVRFATSGPEALAQLAVDPAELVLLDAEMPELDGFAACGAIVRDHPDTAVVFVTAHTDAESESRALAAGAVDFLHKPVSREVVRARVRLHLTLKRRERELRQFNAELEQRVADRTLALREALIQAEAASRAKSAFLAIMSHELRTPLNAILGFAELLEERVADGKPRKWVEDIGVAGRELLGLINDILEMAGLEADAVGLTATEVPLATLLDAAEAVWGPRAAAKGLTLVREVAPDVPPALRGDPGRLGQVVTHLLSNAVKFSARGRITLRARRVTDARIPQVRLEVADEGIGLTPEQQARVFDAFEQGDNSLTRKYGGAGLGLAICKRLVQRMGGAIGVASTPGQGSTFWVTVPLEPSADRPASPEARHER